ncbi:MAG: rod shape-determining protein MreB [Planctomycetota bacterium]|jgi:rod shape-determining protein MreB
MFLSRLAGLFSKDMGIDLGTANTLVCVSGHGIVLNEPSVVTVVSGTSDVVAVGTSAKGMIGRTPGRYEAIRPLRDGVIADYAITEAMLKYFIRIVHGRTRLVQPRMVVAHPSGINKVEKQALLSSALRAGARIVYLVEEPRAAAIGAGLLVEEARGSMIVDIGGGTTEIAIISMADIVTTRSIRIAGDRIDQAIFEHAKNTYNLKIGEVEAERIKIAVGGCIHPESTKSILVKGLDAYTNLPRAAEISADEIVDSIRDTVMLIIKTIRQTLEHCPPEIAADLLDTGMTLCGGGSLLKGLDEMIWTETGLPVYIAANPLACVAVGTGIFLENLDKFAGILESSDNAA